MKIIIIFILILVLLHHKVNLKMKHIVLTFCCFIFLFTFYSFKNEQIISNKVEYMTLLTHYYPNDNLNTGDYIPALKKNVADLKKSGTIKANEYGWYFYISGNKQYLMVATATNEFYKASSHYQKLGRINGLNYRNYKDTFVIEIDGKKYNAMVLDSCGECMKAKYSKEEKIDILTVPRPKVVPDGLIAKVISDGSSNNYNPNTLIDANDKYFTDANDYNPGTNYTGDLINGYLYNRLIKEKSLDSKLTDDNVLSSLTNSVDDIISEIYNRVVIGLNYHGISNDSYIGDIESIGSIESGEVSTWRQCNSAWKNIPLGNSNATICSAGCLATSVAIQIERSGARLSSNFTTKLNPGSMVKYLNQKGGFNSSGNFYWNKASEISPNFKYMGQYKVNKSTVISSVASYLNQGYYLVIHVNGSKNRNTSNHWMAITGVTNNDILIIDPAGRGTSLETAYGLKYADRISVFKVS